MTAVDTLPVIIVVGIFALFTGNLVLEYLRCRFR